MQPWTLMWPHWLSTLSHILFSSPWESFWRIDRPAGEAASMPLLRRLKWAAVIVVNLRGIRWNYQVKNIPAQQKYRRSTFWFVQCLELLKLALISGFLLQMAARLFMTSSNGEVGAVNSKTLTIAHEELRLSFLRVLVFGCGPYFFINLQYVACSIIAVALGLGTPEDWPPFFGRLGDVTTVRGFWGKFWHQSLRRSLTSITGALVDALETERGTSASSYTQLWTAFAMSGVMHAASMVMLLSPTNITFGEKTIGILQFFMWQAAAITAEDFVHWTYLQMTGKTVRSGGYNTLIGYIWVTGSMWYSLPMAGDVMLRLRLSENSFLPFTVFGPWITTYVPLQTKSLLQ